MEEVGYETYKPYNGPTSIMPHYTYTRIIPFSCYSCGEIFDGIEIKNPKLQESEEIK